MAHDHPPAAAHGSATHAEHAATPANPGDHPDGHLHPEHEHPGWKTYFLVGFILTVITAVEVSAYYIKPWEESRWYVPSMLIMSGAKFIIVVMFYMHLKYDHKLFRSLFVGPLIIATATIMGLLFLFGQLGIRLGMGS